jgi:hypothetical protein
MANIFGPVPFLDFSATIRSHCSKMWWVPMVHQTWLQTGDTHQKKSRAGEQRTAVHRAFVYGIATN